MHIRPTPLRPNRSVTLCLAAVGLLGLATLAVSPSPTAAAENDGARARVTLFGGEMDYRSGAEASHVLVTQDESGDVIVIDDADLDTAPPCFHLIANLDSPLDTVNCGDGVDRVNITLDPPGGSTTPEAAIPTEVSGGDGTQVVNLGRTPDASDVEYDGGPGPDVVDYSGADRFVAVSLDDNPDDGRPGDRDDIGPDVERIVASPFPDRLTGSNVGNIFDGGFGPDVISGLGGADAFLEGTRSNGADTLTGGSGRDRVDYSNRSAAVTVSLNGLADDGQAGETDNVRRDVEAVFSGSSADLLIGSNVANTLNGASGDDRLNGKGGPDELIGGGGEDALFGAAGDDRLIAKDGETDLVNCGPGRDVAVVDRLDVLRGCETVTFARL